MRLEKAYRWERRNKIASDIIVYVENSKNLPKMSYN